MVKNDWKGFKGRFWGYVFGSKFLRYVLGFYIFSNKHAAMIKSSLKEKLKNGGHFVDLGAGSGFYTVMATEINKNIKVSAVDISDVMLSKLKDQVEKKNLLNQVSIYKENVEKTSLPSGSADMIMASNLLHELTEPSNLMNNTLCESHQYAEVEPPSR
jgi:ubiquinone/menaquinone biosynthesis C-methylase UbiE